jgi:hypothetical protein
MLNVTNKDIQLEIVKYTLKLKNLNSKTSRLSCAGDGSEYVRKVYAVHQDDAIQHLVSIAFFFLFLQNSQISNRAVLKLLHMHQR